MKRGRKDVYAKYNMDNLRVPGYIGLDISNRTKQARFYQMIAARIMDEHQDEHPELKRIYFHDKKLKKDHSKPELLEQIGRMYVQDSFDEDSCIKAACLAAQALNAGYTVKEVKGFFTRGRKTDEWEFRKRLPK